MSVALIIFYEKSELRTWRIHALFSLAKNAENSFIGDKAIL